MTRELEVEIDFEISGCSGWSYLNSMPLRRKVTLNDRRTSRMTYRGFQVHNMVHTGLLDPCLLKVLEEKSW